MTAAFAALEARANAVVMAKLANATATIGGTDHSCIFDNAFQQTDIQVGATVPTATVTDVVAAGLVSSSSQLTIRGTNYLVVDKQPDGTGLTLLVLQEQ